MVARITEWATTTNGIKRIEWEDISPSTDHHHLAKRIRPPNSLLDFVTKMRLSSLRSIQCTSDGEKRKLVLNHFIALNVFTSSFTRRFSFCIQFPRGYMFLIWKNFNSRPGKNALLWMLASNRNRQKYFCFFIFFSFVVIVVRSNIYRPPFTPLLALVFDLRTNAILSVRIRMKRIRCSHGKNHFHSSEIPWDAFFWTVWATLNSVASDDVCYSGPIFDPRNAIYKTKLYCFVFAIAHQTQQIPTSWNV